MHVKTISVTYGRKINLGDYNSAEIALSLWADLEEGEIPSLAIADLQAQARESAKAEYQRLMARVKQPANGRVKS